MTSRGRQRVATGWRQVVDQRVTGCVAQEETMSTGGRQGVYRREIECFPEAGYLLEGDSCLPEGDRLSTRGRQGV